MRALSLIDRSSLPLLDQLTAASIFSGLDHLIYTRTDQEMILKEKRGKLALFWGQEQNLRISAKEIEFNQIKCLFPSINQREAPKV